MGYVRGVRSHRQVITWALGAAGAIVLVDVEVAVRPRPKFSVPATYRYTVPAARAALSAVC